MGKQWKQWQTLFSWDPKSLQMVTAAMKLKDTFRPWKESYDQRRQHIQKQRRYFVNIGPSSQGYGFSSGHVWMWELDCEEGWAPKNWCFWTVLLEKILESPLDIKEIKPVHPKGNQSWIFTEGTDAEAEAPATGCEELPHWKRPCCWSDLAAAAAAAAARKDWRQEKGTTENEMIGWPHQLDGYEFEQALEVGDGQGSLTCCSPWGCN